MKLKNDHINFSQSSSTVAMFVLGTSLLTSGSKISKENSYISLLIAVLIAVPLMLVLYKILLLYPNNNIYDIFLKTLGKPIGTGFSFLLIIYCFHLAVLTLKTIQEFTKIGPLPKTPPIIIGMIFGILSTFILKQGLRILGRSSLLYLSIIAFSIIFTFFLDFEKTDFTKILPRLESNLFIVIKNAFLFLSLPFSEIIILTTILPNQNNFNKNKNPFLAGLIVGSLLLLISIVKNILSLGGNSFSALYFPSYVSSSIVNVGDFFQRAEVIFSINFLLSSLIKLTVCIYGACKGIVKIFNLSDYRKFIVPITFFIITISTIFLENTSKLFDWMNTYSYYSVPIGVLLPLIIFTVIKIKTRHKKPNPVT